MSVRENKVSRQRLWQIRKVAKGKCCICGKVRVTASHCEFHRKKAVECQKRRYRASGLTTKNWSSILAKKKTKEV